MLRLVDAVDSCSAPFANHGRATKGYATMGFNVVSFGFVYCR